MLHRQFALFLGVINVEVCMENILGRAVAAKKEQLVFGELLELLEANWSFRRAHWVRQVGTNLRNFAEEKGMNLDAQVEVKYKKWGSGDGPDHHYHHQWEVLGVDLPGPASGYPARVVPIPRGFRIW